MPSKAEASIIKVSFAKSPSRPIQVGPSPSMKVATRHALKGRRLVEYGVTGATEGMFFIGLLHGSLGTCKLEGQEGPKVAVHTENSGGVVPRPPVYKIHSHKVVYKVVSSKPTEGPHRNKALVKAAAWFAKSQAI